MNYNPFVESGFGQLEGRVCRFLHVTPMQLGEIRKKDPLGVAFIERFILYEAKKEREYNRKLAASMKVRKRHK